MMETILRAYKTKLRPTPRQRGQLAGCAGYSRVVYNWALADRIELYKAGTPTTKYAQKKRFNAIKDDLYPWCREYPQVISQEAFEDLDTAYKNFFRRVKQGAETAGFPRFKRKGGRDSFRFILGVTVEANRIKFPRLGWYTLAERNYLPTNTTIKQATVSRDADQWFVSVLVEEQRPQQPELTGVLGVDVGAKALVYCSDGTQYAAPDKLKKLEKKMGDLQRKLARQKKGSANREKTKRKIAKLHREIRRHRTHVQHNASAYITRHAAPEVVVIEDLNVKDMTRKPKPKPRADGNGYERNNARAKARINRAILNSGVGEPHRQIQYKADWLGIEVVSPDRQFASSKTCSGCGYLSADLKLSDRTYICPECGLVLDRDLNAAKNLAAWKMNP